MPLRLKPPRRGKSPNWTIRGTHLGIHIDQSARTPEKRLAQKELARIRSDIERGAFVPRNALTFADAVLAYIQADGDTRFLDGLTEYFRATPLPEIDQAAIDRAAAALYPGRSAATRNRQVYTPVSAILNHVGHGFRLKRPKGAQGRQKTEWMTPEQAGRLIHAAGTLDAEFRLFLILLIYTGLRLSEALAATLTDLHLAEALLTIPCTKNGEPRLVHLPPVLVAELANHPRGLDRTGERLFRFRKNGHLYGFMRDARAAAGLPRVSFHTCRHTWATWMRRFGNLDVKGLVDTGAWRDAKSAARYAHSVVTEETRRADLLPDATRKTRGKGV
ncbi:MAG: tyrosine-type recombinase/integrase [Hyphomicrobiaceae bacterium]|nr:tyrosine-type recombinase/integrase [Hyphomicrobiaceae bacterium]